MRRVNSNRGVAISVVTMAMTTRIAKGVGVMMPRCSPILMIMSFIRPRTFISAEMPSAVSRVMTNSDRRTNEQAIAVARGQAELPPFIGDGKTRWQEIRDAYSQAAVVLDATGQPEDRTLASDVRGFLDKHPDMNATPEIFAGHHARNLATARAKPEQPAPEPSPRERERGR